jgi:hypothetical protein
MQTPKEFLAAVSAAFSGIDKPPVVEDLAELEHAAARVPAKIEVLFRNFVPQIIAIAVIAFVAGGSLGVSIGKHVHR